MNGCPTCGCSIHGLESTYCSTEWCPLVADVKRHVAKADEVDNSDVLTGWGAD